MEKILKTLDAIKVPTLATSDANIPGTISSYVIALDSVKTKKKERMAHCRAVADAVINTRVQKLKEYDKILMSVTEVLFQLCNDEEYDIRMTAKDCLGIILKSLKDNTLQKFSIEVYNEIKRDSNLRSLKQAFIVFSKLGPSIRPRKRRAFIGSLLPSFSALSKRTEESLYEGLNTIVGGIFKELGFFLNDNEVKILCNDFMENLHSSSSIVRRESAHILVFICQYTRKPQIFLHRLMCNAINLLMPNMMEKNVHTIIGSLLCIRLCIPFMHNVLKSSVFEQKIVNSEAVVKSLVQIYEICLILCKHDNHNVATTALETLHNLLVEPSTHLYDALTCIDGIQNSFESYEWDASHVEQVSSSTGFDSVAYLEEAKTLMEKDSEETIQFAELSEACMSDSKTEFDIELSLCDSEGKTREYVLPPPDYGLPSVSEQLEELHHQLCTDQEKIGAVDVQNAPVIDIGSLYEKDVPVNYCARFLTYNFLLTGEKGSIKPDKDVKVSAKVLAFNCLIALIKMRPEIFYLTLVADNSQTDEDTNTYQTIDDVLLYLNHNDPVLRGTVYVLVGSILKVTLDTSKYHLGSALTTFQADAEKFLEILLKGLKDGSNICVRYVIGAIKLIINLMPLHSISISYHHILFQALLELFVNPYWLIKIDLINLFLSLNWLMVKNSFKQRKFMASILIDFVMDEDTRLQSSAVVGLVQFVQICCGTQLKYKKMQSMCTSCVKDLCTTLNYANTPVMNRCVDKHSVTDSTYMLHYVLDILMEKVLVLENRRSLTGLFCVLDSLADIYPPTEHKGLWKCDIRFKDSAPLLLSFCIDLLRRSHLVDEISIRQPVMSLACKLFLAADFRQVVEPGKSADDSNPFSCQSSEMATIGYHLVHQCALVITVYHNLMEQQSNEVNRKFSVSPTIKSVKRFSQRLESDKKATDSEVTKMLNSQFGTQSICSDTLNNLSSSVTQAYEVYLFSYDSETSRKFLSFLGSALNILGELCCRFRTDYPEGKMTNFIKEILDLTQIVVHWCPVETFRCIRLLLNSIFVKFNLGSPLWVKCEFQSSEDPYSQFMSYVNSDLPIMPVPKNLSYKVPSEQSSSLESSIRQFKVIVITGLTLYFTTSNVHAQAEILKLLSLLIKSHVNYGQVDSDQVFLNFVTKQIGLLEDGAIKSGTELVKEIFYFLTLLSWNHQHGKKFIEIPSILRLCESFITSEQSGCEDTKWNFGAAALIPVINDLFVRRGTFNMTNLELKDLEVQRESVLQILLKMAAKAESFPAVWLLLKGRKTSNESKFAENSKSLMNVILLEVENQRLQLVTESQFTFLSAIFSIVDLTALPPVENLFAVLDDASQQEICDPTTLIRWSVLVNSYLILFTRAYASGIVKTYEIPSEAVAGCILRLLKKLPSEFLRLSSKLSVGFNMMAEQLELFFQAVAFSLAHEKLQPVTATLQSMDIEQNLIEIADVLKKHYHSNPTLCTSFVKILVEILPPFPTIWKKVFQDSEDISKSQQVSCLLLLVKELNNVECSPLEDMVTAYFYIDLFNHIENKEVQLFIDRLSTHKNKYLLYTIAAMDFEKVDLITKKNLFNYVKKVSNDFVFETAMICFDLMEKRNDLHFSMEVSQFLCTLLATIKAKKLQMSGKDRDRMQEFIATGFAQHQRVSLMCLKLLGKELAPASDIIEASENPIVKWCCEEVTSAEGLALAKMLNTLKYSEIIGIFSHQKFNISIVKHSLRLIINMLHLNQLEPKVVSDLLSSQLRASISSKLPLGVATFDFIVETLDVWEASVFPCLRSFKEELDEKSVLELPFESTIAPMWGALRNVMELKKEVLKLANLPSYNNYVPTVLFTASFQLMRVKCAKSDSKAFPCSLLIEFLTFARDAINDVNFLTFFNDREHPDDVMICLHSLFHILKSVVKSFGINFRFENPEEEYSDSINDTCVLLLKEFNAMLRFIREVECRKIKFQLEIAQLFRSVIAGLGRCELISTWVLICHLSCGHLYRNKADIFPPISQMPTEVLRYDRKLLMEYIFKLNFMGTASKNLFEENWVTFLSIINFYPDEYPETEIISYGLRALSMLLHQSIQISYVSITSDLDEVEQALSTVDFVLKDHEPEICRMIRLPQLLTKCKKEEHNPFNIDAYSCIRFLTDLFSQWLQSSQNKMPLLLVSNVVETIVAISDYFEDSNQYFCMSDTLLEVYISMDKEDEIIWPHLVYGLCYLSSPVGLEPDALTQLTQIIETSLSSASTEVSNMALKGALFYLQNHPDCSSILNVMVPFVLSKSELDETMEDTEAHSLSIWSLLLFIWIHCDQKDISVADFNQKTLSNVLTILSPLNKVNISLRILVLKGLREKIMTKDLSTDMKRKIIKIALESLRTSNMAILFEALKLYLTLFYVDFFQVYKKSEPDLEILTQMMERSEVLFQLLKSNMKCCNLMVSKVLPVVVNDFLPPSEILNRVIADFMTPTQTFPELIAPVLSQVFEKARNSSRDANLVREWVIASLSNFLSSADQSRTMWSLTLLFIGVSSNKHVSTLLPFAQLRRKSNEIKEFFVFAAIDFYSSLDEKEKTNFIRLMKHGPFHGEEKNPYHFLVQILNKCDENDGQWCITLENMSDIYLAAE